MRRFFVVSFLVILLGAGCTQEYERRYDNPPTVAPGQEIEANESGVTGAPLTEEAQEATRVMASSTVAEPEPPAEPTFAPTSSAPEVPFTPTSSAPETENLFTSTSSSF